jgi:hypothetical protein
MPTTRLMDWNTFPLPALRVVFEHGSGHRINSKSYLYRLANPGSLRWECPGYTVVDD